MDIYVIKYRIRRVYLDVHPEHWDPENPGIICG